MSPRRRLRALSLLATLTSATGATGAFTACHGRDAEAPRTPAGGTQGADAGLASA